MFVVIRAFLLSIIDFRFGRHIPLLAASVAGNDEKVYQVISVDKIGLSAREGVIVNRPLILLGAGASVEAGVPTAGQMTDVIVTEIENNQRAGMDGSVKALHYVIGQIIGYATAHGGRHNDPVDVEELFTAVQLLADRYNLEVAPFVEAWKPEVGYFDGPNLPGTFAANFLDAIANSNEHQFEMLFKLGVEVGTSATKGVVYRKLLDHMLAALRKIVRIEEPLVVEYLNPIVRLAQQLGRLTVATLNYDRSIEIVSESAGTCISTGIDVLSKGEEPNPPKSGIYLLKIHGSADWWLQERMDGALPGGVLKQTVVGVSNGPENISQMPGIIFGQREKLRAQGPFLKLFAELDREMTDADELIIVGYSFRDNHINELIRRWINSDRNRHITVIDPEFPLRPKWNYSTFRDELHFCLVPLDRPTQSQPHFEPRITVYRERTSSALEKVFEPFMR